MIPASLIILVSLAALAPILFRVSGRFAGIVAAAVPIGLGVMFATQVQTIAGGTDVVAAWPWVADLGVTLSFRLDGLALTFALLICFIGGMVLLYASSYLEGNPRIGQFFATLIGFMASMLGLVLADNLILVFIFWELTSVTSFLLIGFSHERTSARRAATQALLVTGLGGLVLLAGLILLGLAAGTFEVSELASVTGLVDHALFTPAVVLILLGCFSKSAIVPFHFWLPNAMEAPSPVSALLHSSTMVKAGVYLIARLHPTFGGTVLWDDALIFFGGATMVTGAWLATRQSALKRILAYSTVSSLGVLVMLIGMGAAKAAAAYLLAHAMFKGCLFLVAGTVTQVTGEKDPERLSGLVRVMPAASSAAVLAALSMAGMFPLSGFVGKELVLKAGLAHPEYATLVTVATVVAAVLTVMAAVLVGIRPFRGTIPDGITISRRPDWRQSLGPVVLAVAGLVAGLVPSLFAKPLVAATVTSITGAPYPNTLKLHVAELLWPPTSATVLSIVALSLGVGLYLGRHAYRRLTAGPAALDRLNADGAYDAGFAGIGTLAEITTRFIQNGHLHSYVRTTLVALVVIVSLATLRADAIAPKTWDVSFFDAIIAVSIIGCAITCLFLRSALAAVAVLGGIGFLMALLFVLYGVPDVAMTQFAVETLIVIIFVLVIYHLPQLRNLTSRPRRAMDAIVAGAFGLTMGLLAYAAAARDVANPVSDQHAALSVPGGYGRNVVNVILVDFRALDTLGEVFVLGIAATGVYVLLRARPGARREASA